jgi:hypothetical protein
VEKYEVVLKDLVGDPFRRFVNQHLTWMRDTPMDKDFQFAIDNFIAACIKICSEPASRLSWIIKRSFEWYKFLDKLNPSFKE